MLVNGQAPRTATLTATVQHVEDVSSPPRTTQQGVCLSRAALYMSLHCFAPASILCKSEQSRGAVEHVPSRPF